MKLSLGKPNASKVMVFGNATIKLALNIVEKAHKLIKTMQHPTTALFPSFMFITYHEKH